MASRRVYRYERNISMRSDEWWEEYGRPMEYVAKCVDIDGKHTPYKFILLFGSSLILDLLLLDWTVLILVS